MILKQDAMNALKDQPTPTLIPLPKSPITTSPVPWLTSIHATPGRGEYGNAGYRGNCSGLLIRDLLMFYRPRRVLDPMEGGGTCRDVCKELAISYEGRDLKAGFDATRAESFAGLGTFDFVWLHPPYWQMIRYNSDGRCLSNAPTLEAFVTGLRLVLRNCRAVLAPRGKLAVLMGDGKHAGQYMGLPFRTLNAAEAEGYWLAAPEIIRFGHGSSRISISINRLCIHGRLCRTRSGALDPRHARLPNLTLRYRAGSAVVHLTTTPRLVPSHPSPRVKSYHGVLVRAPRTSRILQLADLDVSVPERKPQKVSPRQTHAHSAATS